MKFSLATTTLLSLLSTSFAAPAPVADPEPVPATTTYPSNQPLPTATSLVIGNTIYNSKISNYNVWTGAVSYNTRNGKIFKNGRQADITSLLTFDVPSWATGRDCQFRLRLRNDGTFSGSTKFDVFTSLAPVTRSTTGWGDGSGNGRNQFLGRMQAKHPGVSTWVDPVVNSGKIKCPAGTSLGIELVGVGDVDDIEWDDRYITAGGELVIL